MKINLERKANTTLAIVAGLTALWGIAVGFDSRYAKSKQLQHVEEEVSQNRQGLNVHLLQQRIDYIQKRIWDLEDRWTARYKAEHNDKYPSKEELVAFMDDETRKTYRDLKDELAKLKAKLAEAQKEK